MPDPTATATGFFQRRPLRRALRHWRQRHQHPFNFWIHMLGIPLAVTGFVLIIVWLFAWPWADWYWGLGGFVLGYVLQWLGHKVEGNDVGEFIPIKRLMGLPTVSVAPQYLKEAGPEKVRPL